MKLLLAMFTDTSAFPANQSYSGVSMPVTQVLMVNGLPKKIPIAFAMQIEAQRKSEPYSVLIECKLFLPSGKELLLDPPLIKDDVVPAIESSETAFTIGFIVPNRLVEVTEQGLLAMHVYGEGVLLGQATVAVACVPGIR